MRSRRPPIRRDRMFAVAVARWGVKDGLMRGVVVALVNEKEGHEDAGLA
jgi:hypothetical protein